VTQRNDRLTREDPPVPTATAPARRREFTDDAAGNDHLWSLVAQIQADPDNDAGPYGELYRLTHPVVFRYIYFRLGSRHDAEDLAADVYVRGRRRIGRLQRQAGSPTAWFITIARNLVADHYKSAQKRLEVLAGEMHGRTPEGRPETEDTRDTTAADAAEIMAAVTLYGGLSRLSPEHREVLRLRYLLGESIAGTAAAMGKNDGAIKALAYRAARAMLRDPAVAELGAALARSRSVA
jgi:RNA polymerase sigma-70 factor (ECF subfamily)